MNVRSRSIAAFVLCLVVTSTLAAAPGAEMPSLFARFWTYLQNELAPPIGTQSKISPPIGIQGRLSPPLPSPVPSETQLATTMPAPLRP